MKVALGQRPIAGAWGGGNRFIAVLTDRLQARGDEVVFALDDIDIDIVLITDPRVRNPVLAFTPGAVLRYVMWRNPRALVVHRINECDERKGTRTMNFRLRLANHVADHTVFIASWLRDLDVWRRDGPSSVILNGAAASLFNAEGRQPWNGVDRLRIVTHHWGAHWMKGFDVYARLDAMLAEVPWRERFEFTYIGNLPKGFAFANAGHLPPQQEAELAQELRRHHVYLTASINEPAGMHHIEGALSGLPLLYRKSGALPEYCEGFGESFAGPQDFTDALQAVTENYSKWYQRLSGYPHSAEGMCGAYLGLFDDMMARRGKIMEERRPWRNPLAVALNQLPW